MTTKAFSRVTVKDADLGEVEAAFAEYEVVDHDGDITTKGALPIGQKVVVSAYGHGSHKGLLPVGKGEIVEIGDEAVLKSTFFMDTTHGRDAFLTIKALSEDGLQEWSYSLQEVTAVSDNVDGKKVRRIQKVGKVKEVSPVLIGAGMNTRTLSTKSAGSTKQLNSQIRSQLNAAGGERWGGERVYVWLVDFDVDEGYAIFEISDTQDGTESLTQVDFTRTDDTVTLGDTETDVARAVSYVPAKSGDRFVEHTKSVVADFKALAVRASEVMALRAEKGKTMSDDSVAELAELIAELDATTGELKSLIAPTPDTTNQAQKELLRAIKNGAMN